METKKEKLIIEYCEGGIYATDHGALKWFKQLKNDIIKNGVKNKHIKLSNEFMVELTRLLVTREIIKPNEIIYKYKDEFIRISQDGGLEKWPEGFCDNTDLLLGELVFGKKSRWKE